MKKFLSQLWLNIYVTINPIYWLQNYRQCKAWDKQLNKLLDNPEFKYVSDHRINLGNVQIWIENYPYAYGSRLTEDEWYFREIKKLPSRKTRIRLRKAVDKYLESYFMQEDV